MAYRDYAYKVTKLMEIMGLKQWQFAKKVDATQPTVSRWVNGTRPDPDWAERIDALWHAHSPEARGTLVSFTAISVMGRIGAGAVVETADEQLTEGFFEIEFTMNSSDMIAFIVEGDSQMPRYDPGDIVICERKGSDPVSILNREAAILTVDGKRYIKKIRSGSEPDRYHLESFNASPMENVAISWASEVSHVVRREQYGKI